MRKRWPKRILKSLLVPVLLYIIIGVCLYLFQDKLLFHPRAVSRDYHYSFDQPYEELNLSFRGENLSIIHFKPANAIRGTVLYFHGNMSNVERYRKDPERFLKNGFELWMIDYPGFGKSTGPCSEKRLYEQALYLYQLASKERQGDSILIYGKSIGTGVASWLASRVKAKVLFLETPYYSIPSLSQYYAPLYPVSIMNRYSFPVYEYLNHISIPVTLFHGTEDGTIPYSQSERLKREHPDIHLVTIPGGGHNNLYDYPIFRNTLDSLLAK